MRYANPHKAFTFQMHGFESIVGPVKVSPLFLVPPSVREPRAHLPRLARGLMLRAICHARSLERTETLLLCHQGVFTKDTNLNKAREHALLISNRPPYVTILTLVRDAAARLPNGEGTRAEVCASLFIGEPVFPFLILRCY